jgi:hypothetical protein
LFGIQFKVEFLFFWDTVNHRRIKWVKFRTPTIVEEEGLQLLVRTCLQLTLAGSVNSPPELWRSGQRGKVLKHMSD